MAAFMFWTGCPCRCSEGTLSALGLICTKCSIGRKPVFLAAVVASLISLVLFVSTRDFHVLALSFAFIGFGRALRSGTLDAWFVETFKAAAPDVDVQPALAKAQWANAVGLAIGAVLGGHLPDILGEVAKSLGFGIYDVSYLASFAVMLGVFFSRCWPLSKNRVRGISLLSSTALPKSQR